MTWMGGEWNNFYRKFLAGELPLAFLTWGSYSIFDASAILDPFFMKDAPGCYGTTLEIDRMLKEAHKSLDQKERKSFFSQIQKAVAEEAFWAPICNTRSLSVMKKNLNFEPSYDEIDRYFRASWKKIRETNLTFNRVCHEMVRYFTRSPEENQASLDQRGSRYSPFRHTYALPANHAERCFCDYDIAPKRDYGALSL